MRWICQLFYINPRKNYLKNPKTWFCTLKSSNPYTNWFIFIQLWMWVTAKICYCGENHTLHVTDVRCMCVYKKFDWNRLENVNKMYANECVMFTFFWELIFFCNNVMWRFKKVIDLHTETNIRFYDKFFEKFAYIYKNELESSFTLYLRKTYKKKTPKINFWQHMTVIDGAK